MMRRGGQVYLLAYEREQSLLQEVDIDPAAPTLSATLLQEVAMAAPFGMSEEDEVDMISRSAM